MYHDPGAAHPPLPVDDYNLREPVGSFIDTVKALVPQPTAFFAGIPRDGGLRRPLAFALISIQISALLASILPLGFFALIALIALQTEGGLEEGGVVFLVITLVYAGGLVLLPLMAAAGLFIWAGILHLLVLLIVRSEHTGFEGTFRSVAYSSVAQLGAWVPFVGSFASFYQVFLLIVSIRELHSTTTARASAVVLIPVGVLILLACVLFFIAFLIGALNPETTSMGIRLPIV